MVSYTCLMFFIYWLFLFFKYFGCFRLLENVIGKNGGLMSVGLILSVQLGAYFHQGSSYWLLFL